MSAICGVVQQSAALNLSEQVAQMVSALRHRGRDGVNLWSSPANRAAFGHLMLYTTPESLHERQPYTLGNLTITADARIDNRDTLITSLALRPSGEAPITDVEILAAAYQRWGVECVKHLIGVFAFAVWDENEHRLFLARDPIGVKPLYIAQKPPYFAFATEITGLQPLPFISCEINPLRVADHLAAQINENELTFYREITRLPPASCLTLQNGNVRTWEYWSPRDVSPLRLPSPADYAEGFREQFTRAVAVNMRSAYPLGSMLSGGLDSSSVTAAARSLMNGEPLHTYSVIYPQTPESDEREFIQPVIDQGGLIPHFIDGNAQSTLVMLQEPHLAANLFMTQHAYAQAERDGVRVVLDGLDGDTTLSHGLGCLPEFLHRGDWSGFESTMEKVRANSDKHQPFSRSLYYQTAVYPCLAHYLRGGRLDKVVWLAQHVHESNGDSYRHLLMRQTLFNALPHRLQWTYRRLRDAKQFRKPYKLFNADFLRASLPHLRRREAELRPLLAPLNAAAEHAALIRNGAIALTNELADQIAGRFSIEARHPFFYTPLVEYCLSLPCEVRLVEGVSRWVMRESMRGLLPDSVRMRIHKTDLSYSFDHSFYTLDLNEQAKNTLRDSALLGDYVDTAAVQAMIAETAERPDVNNPVGYHLWALLLLEQWLRVKS